MNVHRINGLVSLLFAVLLSSPAAVAKDSATNGLHAMAKAPAAQSCTRTAGAALMACRNSADDDFWTAVGNCYNLSARHALDPCVAGAKAARKDAFDDCASQNDARRAVCDALGESPYDPLIDPAAFVDPREIGRSIRPNPYFPLTAGVTRVYRGGGETDTVTVTRNTKVILGVTCAVIRDIVTTGGQVTEDTEDWYAQDIHGGVWYFGEIAQQFAAGELVGIEGSWKGGVEGAKPGILIEGTPHAGDVYRQEFALGQAEDLGQVLSLNGSAVVPAASCAGTCLVTKDFSSLEPDALENKYYAPGVGVILELDLRTGDRLELVSVTP